MRQITHAIRCLSVALVLVAAFVTLAGATQASANDNGFTNLVPTRAEMQWLCEQEGGIYYEEIRGGVVMAYGCLFLDGDDWYCHVWGTCMYIPRVVGVDSSQPPDGQLSDQNQYAPAPSAPTGSSHSGFEYKMVER